MFKIQPQSSGVLLYTKHTNLTSMLYMLHMYLNLYMYVYIWLKHLDSCRKYIYIYIIFLQ